MDYLAMDPKAKAEHHSYTKNIGVVGILIFSLTLFAGILIFVGIGAGNIAMIFGSAFSFLFLLILGLSIVTTMFYKENYFNKLVLQDVEITPKKTVDKEENIDSISESGLWDGF
jgi:membrane protein implicated in regulation of membrane protease activity